MGEMIERVAKAIYKSHGFVKPWNKSPGWHETCRREARAAIQAMRDQTDAMYEKGLDATAYWEESTPERVWQAMIDEALR